MAISKTAFTSFKLYNVLIKNLSKPIIGNKLESCFWLKGKAKPALSDTQVIRKVESNVFLYSKQINLPLVT